MKKLLNKKMLSLLTQTGEHRYENRSGVPRKVVRCVCICGNEKWVRSDYLASKETKSCGQCRIPSEMVPQGNLPLLKQGVIRGGWVVIGFSFKKRENGEIVNYYDCFCFCGKRDTVSAEKLRGNSRVKQRRHGGDRGCGCNFITHDMPIYKLWDNTKKLRRGQATPPKPLCPEWSKNFGLFFVWSMLNGYVKNATLHRRDLSKPLSPENAYWSQAGRSDNSNAIRVRLSDGTVQTAARYFNSLPNENKSLITLATFIDRLKKGYTLEEALKSHSNKCNYAKLLGCTVGGITLSKNTRLDDNGNYRRHFVEWTCVTCGEKKEENILNIQRRKARQEKFRYDPVLCHRCEQKQRLVERDESVTRSKVSHNDPVALTDRQVCESNYQAALSTWRELVKERLAIVAEFRSWLEEKHDELGVRVVRAMQYSRREPKNEAEVSLAATIKDYNARIHDVQTLVTAARQDKDNSRDEAHNAAINEEKNFATLTESAHMSSPRKRGRPKRTFSLQPKL